MPTDTVPVSSRATTTAHVSDWEAEAAAHHAQFIEQGYTIIPGAHSPQWVAAARAAYEPMRERLMLGGRPAPMFFDSILESEPQLGLTALTNARVLAVAELIIGPHVQVESMTFNASPPAPRPLPATAGDIPGWHRDLFAAFPGAEAYQRPLLFNSMTYLQDLSDAVGPLRVIPGSHRRPVAISPEEKQRHHRDAIALYPRAGDAVLFHHGLVHSGSHNQSDEPRYFYCIAYNHCWLKCRNNFRGPACEAIIQQARERQDRRLLRLLGADETILTRALHHDVLTPEEATWREWSQADQALLRPEGGMGG